MKFGVKLWTWDTLPMPNFVKIAKKIAQGACRYRIAPWRWCMLISSFFLYLLRCLSHFSLYYLPLIQLMSISVIIRIMLTVWILYFHAITGLPHTHALCMTKDVVRYVKMRTGAARGLERYKIVEICGLTVVENFYVRERSLYSIRSLILSQWR